jgi:plastocyanin
LVTALAAVTLFAGAARAEEAAVHLDDFAFSPSSLTAKAGATVTWRNRDYMPHTVASSTRLFKSKALDTDDVDRAPGHPADSVWILSPFWTVTTTQREGRTSWRTTATITKMVLAVGTPLKA